MNVLGYADRLSVRHGETIRFMVSCSAASFRADIVRLTRPFAVAEPQRDELVPTPVSGDYEGRVQMIPIGSYVTVPGELGLSPERGLGLHCWIQPGLPAGGGPQGIVASWRPVEERGFWLGLDPAGHVELRAGDGTGARSQASSTEPLQAGRWYEVTASIDPQRGELRVAVEMCRRAWLPARRTVAAAPLRGFAGSGAPLLMGASWLDAIDGGRNAPRGCFNGKLDRPRLWDRPLADGTGAGDDDGLVASWQLGRDVSTRHVRDASPHGRHGEAVNAPMRAVTGANWDGTDISFHARPDQYDAIAFHEDDLEDCCWSPSFALDVPAGLRPGLYAARLEAAGTFDYVPFLVRPRAERRSGVRVAFLVPTNTYLAYGNEKLFQGVDGNPDFVAKTTDHTVSPTECDEFLVAHPELGASVYDRHPDGSGICHSTRLRPVLTMRPQFLTWLTGDPRHFSADLYLAEWLDARGIPFEVLADEDLHLEGERALSPYDVVLTGGHPEYWTSPMLDGLEAYLDGGGRLMYLGGNGFYWVTGIAEGASHLIEVRRGINGTRSWSSHPGETYLSTTGEPGGLWRYRGRPPNALVGVGFASEGWGGAPGYARLPASYDPAAAWVFAGVEADVIGESGLVMGGAAGDEIDRYDLALGTPPETLRLATSEGRHTDYYQLVVEDCELMLPGLGGTEDPRVRADLTLLESPGGGAVFSVGSINWIGSLMVDRGANDVSRVTENVLRRFALLD